MQQYVTMFIGLLVIGIIAIGAVIPAIQSASSDAVVVGTTTQEFTGTAGTETTFGNYQVEAVNTFWKGAWANYTNATAINQTNQSEIIAIAADRNISTIGTVVINVSFQNNTTATANNNTVVVYLNNNTIGTLNTTKSTWASFSGVWGSYLFEGNNQIHFTNDFTNATGTTNITQTNVSYYAYSTNALYNQTNYGITPDTSGYFQAEFTYSTSQSNNVNTILALVPLLIAVVLVILVVGMMM